MPHQNTQSKLANDGKLASPDQTSTLADITKSTSAPNADAWKTQGSDNTSDQPDDIEHIKKIVRNAIHSFHSE